MSVPREILDRLNEAQRRAVELIDGPLMILAGPGSGKTRVITHRAANIMHQGVPGSQILGLTFTNKAAQEMKLRIHRLVGPSGIWMGTFHSFCARLLRQHASLVGLGENFSVYDRDDARGTLREAVREVAARLKYDPPTGIAEEISRAKNRLLTPQEYAARTDEGADPLVAEVYAGYQARLVQNNAVDFDDLLFHTARLLYDHPELRARLDARWRYVMVDEYQDTNLAQFTIVHALSQDYPNLAVTGDPDQSIYGWRGANLGNILQFERYFPSAQIVRLEQNYRSTQRILRVADQLIANNRKRKPKVLFTENPEGPLVRLVRYQTSQDEATGIAVRIANAIQGGRREPKDFAIFYRTNALSRGLEHALRAVHVPYQIVRGVEFYQRKEIKDILAYLHLINNPCHDEAFKRIVNVPSRDIGAKTQSRLAAYATRHRLPLMEAARRCELIESIGGRSAVAVARFVAMMDQLSLASGDRLRPLVERVLEVTGYRDMLEKSLDQQDQDRLENLDELITEAAEFDESLENELGNELGVSLGEDGASGNDDFSVPGGPLEKFLERAALVSDTDDFDVRQNAVTLMTLHAAKGLEFPVVHIVAVEQGTLPHERSRESDDDLEEERRLLFVGITRAQEELQISLAASRLFRGQSRMAIPSSFLMELPRDEMEVLGMESERRRFLPPYDFPEPVWEEPSFDIHGDADATGADAESTETGLAAGQTGRSGRSVRPDHADAGSGESWEEGSGPRRRRNKPDPKRLASLVTTAADLVAGGAPAPATRAADPDQILEGMVVSHPEHGLGRVVEVQGQGRNRTARVQFLNETEPRSYRLAFSPLVPAAAR